MATKKPAAPKESTSTAVSLWEQELAQAAEAQSESEKHSGFKTISTKSGILSIDDAAVPGNELRVIIIGAVHENQLYEEVFDANRPATPVCYAFGDSEESMAPFPEVANPQSATCAGCPQNQWGSAAQGKGKACKNVRRLLCITEDSLESAEALRDAEARVLKVPVMSVKGWSAYVKTVLPDLKRPSWGVVTKIKIVPDAKSQFRVVFSFEELVDFTQETFEAMRKRVAESAEHLKTAYPVYEAEAAPAAPPPRKTVPIKKVGTAAPAPKGKAKY